MKHRTGLSPLALLVSAIVATVSHAQTAPQFDTIEAAVEAQAGKVTLPSGPDSSLVMAPCGGCAAKSFPTTAATTYFIGRRQVTLGELAAAVSSRPDAFLTVRYVVKSGELSRVTADIEEPSGRGR